MKKKPPLKKEHIKGLTKALFWFATGVILGLFFFASFVFFFFQKQYANTVYPGIYIQGVSFGGKTQEEVKDYFNEKNEKIAETKFTLIAQDDIATISAKTLELGYDADLLANQVYSIGRSQDPISNFALIFQAYFYKIELPPSYRYSIPALEQILRPIAEKVKIKPVNALFTFENGKVSTFRPSSNGQELDTKAVESALYSKIHYIAASQKPQSIILNLPIKVLEPEITTEKVNNLGIKELLAQGTSLFQGSIQNRIYNITLAASRVNGVLVAPGETFSFNKALGDVSTFTGYKQAYVIQNGRTVLGDGGGVCQVSTTLFRAILNAGLPIVERHAHAYRVGYYEQDSPAGLDATIYVPGIDLKFKNDTGHYILIQTSVDPNYQQLTFELYGTKDGRQVTLSKPVITTQTPPPPPMYQDDPTLPKGVEKQVDFAAAGANVYFTREVKKDEKVIIFDKFTSNYRPWQAVFLRGTKEG